MRQWVCAGHITYRDAQGRNQRVTYTNLLVTAENAREAEREACALMIGRTVRDYGNANNDCVVTSVRPRDEATPAGPIEWRESRTQVEGPQRSNEVHAAAPGTRWAVVGIGADVRDSNAVMLMLVTKPINADGSLGEERIVRTGRASGNKPELLAQCDDGYVVIGVEMGVRDSNMDVIRLHARRIDPKTGRLTGDVRTFTAGKGTVERSCVPATDGGEMLVKLGFEVHDNNIDRLEVTYGVLSRRQ